MSFEFVVSNAGYVLFRFLDLISTVLRILCVKFVSPRRSVIVPFDFVSGRSLNVRIRRSGKLFVGNRVTARVGLNIFCDGGQVKIGDEVFFNNNCSLTSQKSITICDGTIIGEGVKIYDHDHMINESKVEKDKFVVGDVKVGRNCWIGSNTIILKGTSICDNVVIGAGSIVTKSISKPGIYMQKRITSCASLRNY